METLSPASRTTWVLSESSISETLSRHSPINPMPARAQLSAASRTLQLLVVFWLRLSRDGSGGEELTLRHPGNRQYAAHTFSSEIWVVQEPSAVHEDEQFGEVRHRAGAFLSSDHSKVTLVAVYVGQKDDACLVVTPVRARTKANMNTATATLMRNLLCTPLYLLWSAVFYTREQGLCYLKRVTPRELGGGWAAWIFVHATAMSARDRPPAARHRRNDTRAGRRPRAWTPLLLA